MAQQAAIAVPVDRGIRLSRDLAAGLVIGASIGGQALPKVTADWPFGYPVRPEPAVPIGNRIKVFHLAWQW
jgi:hypothetical protein